MNKLIRLKKIKSDDNGSLSFFEGDKDIPFEIKRIYYIYSVPVGAKRGMHAHKKLKQIMWCPYGEIEVILDNGKSTESYLLDSPEKGLIITKGYWRDFYIRKEGSVLCVAASDYYTEDDYIRDYTEFKRLVEKGYWENENQF